MSLNIKDERTHAMVRELAATTGESQTEAVRIAVQERLARLRAQRKGGRRLAERLNEIALHCASLPRRNDLTDDEILGYDERGLPR
ncbi:MAG: type II toxin-antitoxin system VapB family antitoxin [Rhodospirillaceae bacterium]